MKFGPTKSIFPFVLDAGPWLIVVMLTTLLSSCATPGTQKDQQPATAQQVKQAKGHCATASGQQSASASPQTSPNQAPTQTQPAASQVLYGLEDCLPKGVIEVVEGHPLDPEVKTEFDKAVVLLQAENYPEAIRLLKAVTGKAGKFTGPHINLGIAYLRSGELDKAEESLKKALELNKAHPIAINEMALLYRKTGRYADARQFYETLLSMYPDFLPARKNFGVLCDIYLQDLRCAMEQYEEYLKGTPDDEKVKIWVADVKSRM